MLAGRRLEEASSFELGRARAITGGNNSQLLGEAAAGRESSIIYAADAGCLGKRMTRISMLVCICGGRAQELERVDGCKP